MAKKPRILFILSTLLGHKVYSHRIYEAVKDLDCIDKEYLYINGDDYKKFSLPGFLPKSDIFTAAWIAKKKFESTFNDYLFDGFFFQTWDAMFGLWKWGKKIKTTVVTDVTPIDMMKLIEREQIMEKSLTIQKRTITFLKIILLNRVLKPYFKKANYFLTWSNWCADSLRNDYGVSSNKINILPCPIDTNLWKPKENGSSNDKPVILFVGDFQRKGGELLLNIYNKQLSSICSLRIITTTWPVGKIVPLGVELVNSWIEQDKLIGLYQGSDLFIMPTVRETFGIALAEAVSVGLPVLTTYNVSGMREIVKDGIDGYLIPYGNEKLWTEKIKLLVEDTNLRTKMSKSARELALENFSLDIFNSKVTEAVKAMINA